MAALCDMWSMLQGKLRALDRVPQPPPSRVQLSRRCLSDEQSMRVALCIVAHEHGGYEKAVQFLASHRVGASNNDEYPLAEGPANISGAAGLAVAMAERRLKAVERSLSPSDMQGITEDPSSLGRTARRQAHEWLRNECLVHWVSRQNTKGLAVPGRALWEHREGPQVRGTSSSVLAGGPSIGGPLTKGQKQWLRRWTRRNHMHRGRFQQGPALPLEAMRRKDGTASTKNDQAPDEMYSGSENFPKQGVTCEALVSGPKSGTVFGAIVTCGNRNGGHQAVRGIVPRRAPFSFFSAG